jgi:hypothetical protein
MAIKSACDETCALTSDSALATASASPTLNTELASIRPLLRARSRIRAVVDGCHRTSRHAAPAIDALVRMDVEHRARRELGFVLARMDAVDGANVDAGGIFRADARVGDDERHDRELIPAVLTL